MMLLSALLFSTVAHVSLLSASSDAGRLDDGLGCAVASPSEDETPDSFDLHADVSARIKEFDGIHPISEETLFQLPALDLIGQHLSAESWTYLHALEDYRQSVGLTHAELAADPSGDPLPLDYKYLLVSELEILVEMLGDQLHSDALLASFTASTPGPGWFQLMLQAVGASPWTVTPIAAYILFLNDCYAKADAWNSVKDERWSIYVAVMKYNCEKRFTPPCTFTEGGVQGCPVLHCDCPPGATPNGTPKLELEQFCKWKSKWGPVFQAYGQCLDKDMVAQPL